MTTTPVDFWFDPGCPFTWRTYRWISEVADAGAADVTWRLMSLGVLNAGKEIPEQYRAAVAQGGRVLRAFAAAEREGGQQALAALYTALGTRQHEKGEGNSDEVVADAVADAGLPESVARAVDDESLDAVVRTSHDASQAAVGDEAGSPIVRIGGDEGKAYFGPVVVPAPTGEEALRLFEAVRLLASVPAFSELKGSRGSL